MRKLDALRFAVRFRVLARLLSELYGLLGALTLIPFAVSLATGSPRTAWVYLGIAAGLGGLFAAGRRLPPALHVQRNEAAVIVALLFVTVSLAMAMPLMSYGIGFIDAWFEAVSGVTTTGLSTLPLAERPAAFFFGRGWMQWLGGIGVVVLALAVLVTPGRAAQSLGFSATETADTVGGTRAHARRAVTIYLALTALGIAALLVAGVPLLDAVVHCMAAVSTGGFANHADSLASVSTAHVTIVSLLCCAGAISFHVYYLSIVDLRRRRHLDGQFYALLLMIGGTCVVVAGIGAATGLELGIGEIVATVVSAQTTAGFSTTTMTALPSWLVLILCLLMLVGGGVGSTSGGIKLGRVLLIGSWIRMYLVRTALAERTHATVRVRGRRVESADLEDVFAVVGLFVLVLVISWLVFLTHGYAPLPALFEVISALSTAGLSVGVTSAELPTSLKLVLCFDMLFGRVEVIALFMVLLPRTWIGRRRRFERRDAR